jgi:hypothetical protein
VVNQMGFRTPTGCEFFPSTIHRIMKRNKAS